MISEPILRDDAPWKKRFIIPQITVQFARRNPNRALVITREKDIYELYAYELDSKRLVQKTKRPSGTLYGSISPDGSYICFMDDKKGNETGHIVRVPFEGGLGELEDLTPDFPEYTLAEPFFNDSNSLMGITIPQEDGFYSFVIDIFQKKNAPRIIHKSKKSSFGPLFSSDGKVSVVISAEMFGGLDFTLIAYDTESGKKLGELADENSKIEPSDFSPIAGDQRLLAMSNHSGQMRPLVWDISNGVRTNLKMDLEGDVAGVGWSPDASKLLLYQTNNAVTRLWIYEIESQKLSKVPHPTGMISAASFETNEGLVFEWQDSTNPSQIISLNLNYPKQVEYHLAPKDVPKSRPWQSASCRSTDGQEIQFWYAVPEGKGPFPTILETHGGPTAAQFNTFLPRSQIWLDHGFAYASVNYRGSTTFGKDFEKKINGDLGHWEVEDMVAARQWLVKSGISRPDEIFVTGWSYGGYLTLQSMSLYPQLWAGGMGGVVVADWLSEYEDESEAMRGYDVALLGGTPNEKKEAYERASPINYLQRLVAPVLIIQGRNDVRCPPRQVELYASKAKTLGKEVMVVWFDTGHAGSRADVKLAIAHQELFLKFVYDVLERKKQAQSHPM